MAVTPQARVWSAISPGQTLPRGGEGKDGEGEANLHPGPIWASEEIKEGLKKIKKIKADAN